VSDIAASCCSPFSRERGTPLTVVPVSEVSNRSTHMVKSEVSNGFSEHYTHNTDSLPFPSPPLPSLIPRHRQMLEKVMKLVTKGRKKSANWSLQMSTGNGGGIFSSFSQSLTRSTGKTGLYTGGGASTQLQLPPTLEMNTPPQLLHKIHSIT
jgi:hypothetical protein